MDPFKASLAHYRLGLLVPALLSPPGWSGRLVLERGPERRELRVVRGCVEELHSNLPGEHLGQSLSDLRLLGAAEAAVAFEQARLAGRRVGAWMIDAGLTTAGELVAAMAWRVRLALLECYAWESGDVTVLPDAPGATPDADGPGAGFPLARLHEETSRALPGWLRFRALLPRLDAPTEALRDAPLPPDGQEGLLALAATGAPVRQLLASRGLDPAPAAEGLLALVDGGFLRAVGPDLRPGPPDLAGWIREARHQLERGSPGEAARLLGRALRAGPVPEAAALYREAAAAQGHQLRDALGRILPRLRFLEAPSAAPVGVIAADLVVLARLRGSPHPAGEVRGLPMAPRALLASLRRLASAGLVAAAA